MSQAATADSTNQGKLTIERISEGDIVCIRFAGVMDESFEGKRLGSSIRARVVILDMGRVAKISSFGIREWSEFIGATTRNSEQIYLVECTSKVMDQINMVAGFLGKSKIVSFYGPYRCDHCDIDQEQLFQVDRDSAAIRSFEAPEQLCKTCARPQFFDEDPSSFFASVAQQPQFDLATGVSEFLATKLNYSISGGNRRLQIDKYVEGHHTYIRLRGNLDGSFSSEKVADGLEGKVVVDVSGLGSVDLAGAAEWRNFIALARGGAERIYVTDCPPVLLERLPRTEDLGDEVVSISMPYSCASCSTTTSENVDVAEHYEILSFATPPEMKCSNCKQATVCAAQEGLLSRLRGLPAPTIDGKLRAFIKTARKRKPEKQSSEAEGVGVVAGKRTLALVGISLAAAAAATGVMLYYVNQQDDTQEKLNKASEEIRNLVSQKEAERPAWITSTTPFAGYCVDQIGSMVCVGISSYRGTLEEAKTEAREVALEEVANAIAIKFDSELYDTNVRPMYSQSRSELLIELDKYRSDTDDENYELLYEQVKDARRRAAEALMVSSNDSMPKQHSELFWEKYIDRGSDEFLVYTRYDINTDALKVMGRIYTSEVELGGSKVMTASPLLAWSHKDFAGGVLVTSAAEKLESAGNSGVIVSVDGQPISGTSALKRALESGAGQLSLAEKSTAELPSKEDSEAGTN